MLTITNMSKSFGEHVLFENVAIQINLGDRIALVGPNGTGKSTLFSLVLGADVPDTGDMALERRSTIGHLPQEIAAIGDETVLELATATTPEIANLLRRIKLFEAGHDTDSDDFHEVQERFEAIGGYQLEAKAKAILSGLAFHEQDFERPLKAMSGGWIMRAHLARLLVQQPDLLLLDEPTNHLDLEALRWFQDFLQSYAGAILLISHDREFLNSLAGSVLEIRQRRVQRYRGNYDAYLLQRAAQDEQLMSAYKNQQKEIQQLQEFVNRFRAKNTKASQVQSTLKKIERMDKIEAPVDNQRTIRFRFPQPPRSGRSVVKLRDIHQAYGETVVYQGMDLEIERGQRIVLVGPNGAGKSTLLKILAATVPFQSGSRELGVHVNVGYYAQYRVEMLSPERSVLEEASDTLQPTSEQFIRTVLGSFLFTGDDVFKKVAVLSGGEKSRLALVKLLLDPPNLLLMDEPTTHLDIPSIDALISALESYEGTLIFISHDVYFIRKLAKRVLHVDAGRLRHYHGDYQYYLEKSSAPSEREALTATSGPGNAQPGIQPDRPSVRSKEQKRREAEARNVRFQQRREHQRVVAAREKEIARLETQQEALAAELELPETYEKPGHAVSINRKLTHVVDELTRATAEWEQAASKVEALS